MAVSFTDGYDNDKVTIIAATLITGSSDIGPGK